MYAVLNGRVVGLPRLAGRVRRGAGAVAPPAGEPFDAPQYDDLAAVANFNEGWLALPALDGNGDPILTRVNGKFPKRSATFKEWFAFTCSSTQARTYVDQGGVVRDMATGQPNNLAIPSNAFSGAGWTRQGGCTTTDNTATGPTGALDAATVSWAGISAGAGFYNVGGALAGQQLALKSIWIRADVAGGTVDLTDAGNTQGTTTHTLTTDWQRVYLRETGLAAGFGSIWIKKTASSPDAIYVSRAQVDLVPADVTAPRTYVPTTTAAVYTGLDAPRFTYANGKRQLRLEGQATNLWPYSRDLTGAGASGSGYTVTATRLTGTTNSWFYRRDLTLTAASYTMSAKIRSYTGSNQTFRLLFNNGASADLTATAGWQIFTFTGVAAASLASYGITRDSANNLTDLEVEYIQLELGSFASDHIPTTSAAVTRAIETARMSPLMEALGQRASGTWVVRGDLTNTTGYARFMGFDANRTPCFARPSGNTNVCAWNGVSDLDAVLPSGSNRNPLGVATAWDGSGRAIVANGGAVASDAQGMGAVTVVYLGRAATIGTGEYGDGFYDLVGWSPERLANATLQTLAVPA